MTTRFQLDNDMTVLIKEMHHAPVASFWIWYRVGSGDERPGITGISHWIEHMLFKGTPRFPRGEIDRQIARSGGGLNGMTSIDYTTYYEVLPAHKIELAFQIEADRMVNSLFDPDEIETERTVIISERQGAENNPRFLLNEEVTATAFRVHPYHSTTLGDMCDLQSMTRADLWDRYQTTYRPNNAIAVLVGDVDEQKALDQIQTLFGGIAAGPELGSFRRPEPEQKGERRVTREGQGGVAHLQLAYHTPESTSGDFFAMLVMDAALTGPAAMSSSGGGGTNRTSRLYQALVETELAASVGSSLELARDPFLYDLSATVRTGRTIQEVEDALLHELSVVAESSITEDELAKAIKQSKAQFAYAAEESINQAYWLGWTELLGSYIWFEQYIERLSAVTVEDVQRVASHYLKPANRTVGWYVPVRPLVKGPLMHSVMNGALETTMTNGSTPDLSSLPGPESIGRRMFPNGSVGLAWENQSSSSVFIYGWLWTGNVDESAEQAGLANLTASLLSRGTENRTMIEISEEIESLGAAMSIHSGGHTTAFTAKCLLEDLQEVQDVLTDCLYRPTFPQEQIERRRGQILTALEQRKNNTRAMANLRYYELMYPNHPYGRSQIGYPTTIENLTRDDILAFYQNHYGARRAGATIAGPIPVEQGLDLLQNALGTWQGAQRDPASLPRAAVLETTHETYSPIPDKSQSDIYLGWPGLKRRDPDFIPAHLANCILGQFGMMGRLGEHVREEQGLAYYSYSALDAGLEPGTWTAVAGVAPENVERAIESILDQVQRMRTEPVPVAELADNKAYLIGSLPLRIETKERVAYQIAHMELFELGLDYLRRYPALIQAVATDDIMAVTRRLMNPDQYVLSVAGPPTGTTDEE